MWYMKFKSLEVIEMFSGALNKKKVSVRRHKYAGDSVAPALAEAAAYPPAVNRPLSPSSDLFVSEGSEAKRVLICILSHDRWCGR